jgi:putative transposase
VALPLGDKTVEWILARAQEDGRLVLAAAWVGAGRRSRAAKLYVALAFRRDVVPMEVKRLLAVDLNALHNGVSWAVVEGERILKRGVLRPDVSKLIHLQKRIAELDSLCANKGKACEEATAAKSRLWRIPRRGPPGRAARPSRASSPRRRRGVERGHPLLIPYLKRLRGFYV